MPGPGARQLHFDMFLTEESQVVSPILACYRWCPYVCSQIAWPRPVVMFHWPSSVQELRVKTGWAWEYACKRRPFTPATCTGDRWWLWRAHKGMELTQVHSAMTDGSCLGMSWALATPISMFWRCCWLCADILNVIEVWFSFRFAPHIVGKESTFPSKKSSFGSGTSLAESEGMELSDAHNYCDSTCCGSYLQDYKLMFAKALQSILQRIAFAKVHKVSVTRWKLMTFDKTNRCGQRGDIRPNQSTGLRSSLGILIWLWH